MGLFVSVVFLITAGGILFGIWYLFDKLLKR